MYNQQGNLFTTLVMVSDIYHKKQGILLLSKTAISFSNPLLFLEGTK